MNYASTESPIVDIPWGGLVLPDDHLQAHSFVVGSPGSGKTLILRMLMRAALLDFAGKLRVRAMVYDGKQEFYPLLIGMGVPAEKIHILLPTDARSVPWHIAADVHTLEDMRTLASVLVPQNPGDKDPYFSNACRAVLSMVFWSLHMARPRNWTLFDVVNVMRDRALLESTLSETSEGRLTYKAFFFEERSASSVMATIHVSVVAAYETVSILWRKSRTRHRGISLTDWARDPASGVLILMPDLTSASMTTINLAMFRWIAQRLDARPDIDAAQLRAGHESWLFLDEFRYATELPMLGDLLGKGRSKGIRVAMATQSIEGVVAVYGEPRTYEMISNAANLAVLRMAGSPAVEKVAKIFGQYEVWEEDFGESTSRSYSSFFRVFSDSMTVGTSRSRKRVLKDNVLISTLTGFPPASPTEGVHGYFATPSVGTWQGPIPWQTVQEWIRDKDAYSPGFVPRAVDDYYPPATHSAPLNGAMKEPNIKPATSAPDEWPPLRWEKPDS